MRDTILRTTARALTPAHIGSVVWVLGTTPATLSDVQQGPRTTTLYLGGRTLTLPHTHTIVL